MDVTERNKAYNKYVEKKIPKTKWFPSLINSFWVGGLICCLGQGIFDSLRAIFTDMTEKDANTWMLIALIFIASVLTGVGVFDRIASFAGAGTIVPITGFANSVVSPAMEFRREGIIFGLCAKMFIIAGPVIVTGILGSIIVGIIYLIF